MSWGYNEGRPAQGKKGDVKHAFRASPQSRLGARCAVKRPDGSTCNYAKGHPVHQP